jgi:hypothetical protein
MAIEFICEHCGTRHTLAMLQTGPSAQTRADQLVAEWMGQESGESAATLAETGTTATAVAPAARSVVAEKAAPKVKPAPKVAPKIKQSITDSIPLVPLKYLITLGVLAVTLGAVWILPALGKERPADLANKALSTADMPERVNATVALAADPRKESVAELRRVAENNPPPAILTVVISGLAQRHDTASIKLFVDALDHADLAVRLAAFEAFRNVVGLPQSEEADFKPDDPIETRGPIAKRLQNDYTRGKKPPGPEPR